MLIRYTAFAVTEVGKMSFSAINYVGHYPFFFFFKNCHFFLIDH